MLTAADVYIWIKDNSWWLWGLVPFAIVVMILRSASVR